MANGFEKYTKKTRRALFLEQMEQVVPWKKLCGLVEPFYPKSGNGRPPVGVERIDSSVPGGSTDGAFPYSLSHRKPQESDAKPLAEAVRLARLGKKRTESPFVWM